MHTQDCTTHYSQRNCSVIHVASSSSDSCSQHGFRIRVLLSYMFVCNGCMSCCNCTALLSTPTRPKDKHASCIGSAMARAGKTHIHQRELRLVLESRRPPGKPFSCTLHRSQEPPEEAFTCGFEFAFRHIQLLSLSLGGLMPATTAWNQTCSHKLSLNPLVRTGMFGTVRGCSLCRSSVSGHGGRTPNCMILHVQVNSPQLETMKVCRQSIKRVAWLPFDAL